MGHIWVNGGALNDAPTLSEKNATVAVGATSTALIGASPNAARHTTLVNTGSQTVYLGFDEAATTAMFPLAAGAVKETDYLGAINGIVASGTNNVAVLGVAR